MQSLKSSSARCNRKDHYQLLRGFSSFADLRYTREDASVQRGSDSVERPLVRHTSPSTTGTSSSRCHRSFMLLGGLQLTEHIFQDSRSFRLLPAAAIPKSVRKARA